MVLQGSEVGVEHGGVARRLTWRAGCQESVPAEQAGQDLGEGATNRRLRAPQMPLRSLGETLTHRYKQNHQSLSGDGTSVGYGDPQLARAADSVARMPIIQARWGVVREMQACTQ